MRRFIIDTDTASDDAVAIMMASAHADVTLDAVTVVAGNVALEQASRNARYVLELCHEDIPVYNGCPAPWVQEASVADWFHGEDGMGNQHYPAPTTAAQTMHAVPALIDRFKREPNRIELVTLGPLTNLATALTMEPALADWIKHCWVMGGAANTVGNVTPAAEYNIWCDPEAAYKVMHSGVPLTLLGWELSCDKATLSDAEMAQLRAIGSRRAKVAIDCNAHALKAVRELQGQTGLALADPVAMAVALDKSIATDMEPYYVDIAMGSSNTRGMTIVDQLHVTGQPHNARVCRAIDAERWKRLLRCSLSVE